MARRTKRLWTDEEKRSICLQTTAPGVSVARVAQLYAMNANLIFKWLRDPRYAPEPSAEPDVAYSWAAEQHEGLFTAIRPLRSATKSFACLIGNRFGQLLSQVAAVAPRGLCLVQ